MKVFMSLMILFMLLTPAYSVTTKPIDADPYFKWTLDIYGDIAVSHEIKVYEEGEVKKADVLIYNLSTGKKDVIDRPGVKVAPTVYGNYVLYEEEIADSIHNNLWLYNIKTKEEKMIKSYSAVSTIIEGLCGKDCYLYYSNGETGRYQIYLCNITTGEKKLIGDDKNADCISPCIYGDKMAYIKGTVSLTHGIEDPKLILRNLYTGEEKTITQAHGIGHPSMSENIVAWIEASEDHKYVAMCYNIKTGEKKKLPVYWTVFAEIFVYDSTIVFTGADERGYEMCIGGYDLSTDTYFPISIPSTKDDFLITFPRIYENRVVWIDWRDSPRPADITAIQPNEIWMAEIEVNDLIKEG